MPAPGGPHPYSQYERLYPDRDTGPYLLRLTFAVIDERPEVVGIEMWGQEPPTADRHTQWEAVAAPDGPLRITSTAIRLPLDRLAAEAFENLGIHVPLEPRPLAKGPSSEVGRPPEYGDDHWRLVAGIYSAALRRGGHPTTTVAQHFKVSKSAAAKWVARCRAMELLPPATKGRAAGSPEDE